MMAQRVRREGSEGAERSRGDLGRCGQRGVLASVPEGFIQDRTRACSTRWQLGR